MAYVTLATLKDALGIKDTSRDTLLEGALAAAERSVNNRAGRRFDRTEEAEAREFRTRGRVVSQGCDGVLLLLDDIATETGLVVETGSGDSWSTLDPDSYETDPDSAEARERPITGLLAPAWFSRRVRVTAVWGWPSVPDDIAQAVLLQASRLYRRKDSPEGTAGSSEWGLIRIPSLDPDVRALVDPYRRPGFGGA